MGIGNEEAKGRPEPLDSEAMADIMFRETVVEAYKNHQGAKTLEGILQGLEGPDGQARVATILRFYASKIARYISKEGTEYTATVDGVHTFFTGKLWLFTALQPRDQRKIYRSIDKVRQMVNQPRGN